MGLPPTVKLNCNCELRRPQPSLQKTCVTLLDTKLGSLNITVLFWTAQNIFFLSFLKNRCCDHADKIARTLLLGLYPFSKPAQTSKERKVCVCVREGKRPFSQNFEQMYLKNVYSVPPSSPLNYHATDTHAGSHQSQRKKRGKKCAEDG